MPVKKKVTYLVNNYEESQECEPMGRSAVFKIMALPK